MEPLLDEIRAQLRRVFSGRPVILAGGVAATAVPVIDQLRDLGAGGILVLSKGPGTGAQPAGTDVEVVTAFVSDSSNFDEVAGFREVERSIAQPSGAVVEAIRRFDPRGDALVLVPMFLDVRALGDRRAFGARRPEWVALEDKTIADALFDRIGVPRPPSTVVVAEPASISDAVALVDTGAGTVWSADARDGFNGGGTYVRWVRDASDRREALEWLLPRCDRVRVAGFVEGVPCSIHGFVVDDGVAVFRPVELVTLRAPSPPRLRFSGCATFFDPSAEHLATMRTAARRVGEHLRTTVGYRGAFTLDGIASSSGWVATECNPRFGAGLGYVAAVLPELCLPMLHGAAIEGRADVPSARLEEIVVDAGNRTRWGDVSVLVEGAFAETESWNLVGDAGDYRVATGVAPGPTDATVTVGPAPAGGCVRVAFDPGRIPSGHSIAPRAAAALACIDRELGLGLGPLEPARPA